MTLRGCKATQQIPAVQAGIWFKKCFIPLLAWRIIRYKDTALSVDLVGLASGIDVCGTAILYSCRARHAPGLRIWVYSRLLYISCPAANDFVALYSIQSRYQVFPEEELSAQVDLFLFHNKINFKRILPCL